MYVGWLCISGTIVPATPQIHIIRVAVLVSVWTVCPFIYSYPVYIYMQTNVNESVNPVNPLTLFVASTRRWQFRVLTGPSWMQIKFDRSKCKFTLVCEIFLDYFLLWSTVGVHVNFTDFNFHMNENLTQSGNSYYDLRPYVRGKYRWKVD